MATTILLAPLAMPSANAAAKSWKSARVISTGMHGYGSRSAANSQVLRREDIWWSYCIISEGRTYSVLSREKPARTGLKENTSIKFVERRNELDVLNPAGKLITLKILRRGKGQECP